MPRYIDADRTLDALNEAQNEFDTFYKGLGKAKSIVMEQPTADVAPVVHAHWILLREPNGKPYCFSCSNCDFRTKSGLNFCGDCGAIMDEFNREQ